MEILDTLRNSRLFIALAAGSAAISLAGCGTHEIIQKPRNEGKYGANSWIYTNANTNSRLEARCVGNALYIKTVRGEDSDDEHTWLNDPACADNKLTPKDNIAAEVAEAS